MSVCPCDQPRPLVLNIPAGLDALPRQLQSFPEVREALLRTLPSKGALDKWRARGQRDLGLMWLEMWAYVSDVLAFYDERIANETYLRTARLKPSLRRLVELLGFIPTPGVAGSVSLALIAEGRVQVVLPPGTGFRSDAFGSEPPQVFEIASDAAIHPLQNEWSIGPIHKGTLPEITPTLAEHPEQGVASPPLGEPILSPRGRFSPASLTQFFTFETENFGLARDRLVLFLNRTNPKSPLGVSTVKQTKPFEGRDGRTYVEVEVEPGIALPHGIDPAIIKVSTPTVSAVPTKNDLRTDALKGPVRDNSVSGLTEIFLDAIYRQLRTGDFFVVAHEESDLLEVATASKVVEDLVNITGTNPVVSIPVTTVTLDRRLRVTAPNVEELTFHFAFVDAGTVTTVASTDIAPGDLTSQQGVPITGNVQAPPNAKVVSSRRDLSQKFLLGDARDQGALVDGVMKFFQTGRAAFVVTNPGDTERRMTAGSVLGSRRLPWLPLGAFGRHGHRVRSSASRWAPVRLQPRSWRPSASGVTGRRALEPPRALSNSNLRLPSLEPHRLSRCWPRG